MDNSITRGIVYGTHPPKGIYFTVVIEYNSDNPIFDGLMQPGYGMVSMPIKTFPEAMDMSEQIVKSLSTEKFPSSSIVETDPGKNGYHYYLTDQQKSTIARIGINTYDIRKETLH